MSRAFRALLALAAALAAATCGDAPNGPPKPVPGVLTLTLVTPNADDRAILVRVTGPEAMTDVASASGAYELHARGAGGTSVRAAAFGPIAGGALLRFAVPDVNRSAEYVATVEEASDGANALRAELGGYRLTVGR